MRWFAMESACLATLNTSCDLGPVQFVSTAYALTGPRDRSSVNKGEEVKPPRDQQGNCDLYAAVGSTAGATVEVFPQLLDGFTIEAWAACGRLKAKIATNVCKENGRLKRRLESMSKAAAHCTSKLAPPQDVCGKGSRDIDPVFEHDPWLSVGTRDSSWESAWFKRRGVQRTCGGGLQLQRVAPWQFESDEVSLGEPLSLNSKNAKKAHNDDKDEFHDDCNSEIVASSSHFTDAESRKSFGDKIAAEDTISNSMDPTCDDSTLTQIVSGAVENLAMAEIIAGAMVKSGRNLDGIYGSLHQGSASKLGMNQLESSMEESNHRMIERLRADLTAITSSDVTNETKQQMLLLLLYWCLLLLWMLWRLLLWLLLS